MAGSSQRQEPCRGTGTIWNYPRCLTFVFGARLQIVQDSCDSGSTLPTIGAPRIELASPTFNWLTTTKRSTQVEPCKSSSPKRGMSKPKQAH
jgi:hypothetical protein